MIANGGTEDEAKAFLAKSFENTVALPGSGRDATTAFTSGNGDVLISYENEAKAFLTKFFENTVAPPGSARDATTAFTSGNGDVLISYENEAILARASGEDFE